MERVERIKNLNVRGFCAQGIVSADATIRMSIAWCRPAGCRPITPLGATRAGFFLPVQVLSRVFRGKFVAGLGARLRAPDKLGFHGGLNGLGAPKAFAALLRRCSVTIGWSMPRRPFGGPEHVLHYLARYTHRVAISNHRIVGFADGKVTFRWKDYAHKDKKRLMTLTAEEFLRRFLLHTLPRGFVRIRFCGFLANRRRRELLPLCRRLLNACPWLRRSTAPAASEPTAVHCRVAEARWT